MDALDTLYYKSKCVAANDWFLTGYNLLRLRYCYSLHNKTNTTFRFFHTFKIKRIKTPELINCCDKHNNMTGHTVNKHCTLIYRQ